MFKITASVVRAVVSPGRGEGILPVAAGFAVPAVLVGEAAALGLDKARHALRWFRKAAARALRQLAEVLDPAPLPRPRVVTLYVPLTRPADVERLNASYLDGLNDGRAEALADVRQLNAPPTLQSPAEAATIAAAASDTASGPAAGQVDPVPPCATADALRGILAEHGSIRGAARALGIAESTLRSRCRKAGIR